MDNNTPRLRIERQRRAAFGRGIGPETAVGDDDPGVVVDNPEGAEVRGVVPDRRALDMDQTAFDEHRGPVDEVAVVQHEVDQVQRTAGLVGL